MAKKKTPAKKKVAISKTQSKAQSKSKAQKGQVSVLRPEVRKKLIPRKFTRFVPDVGAMAYILTDKQGTALPVPLPCLVIEESFGGCSLVAVQDALFQTGAEFTVQVGKLAPMKAKVRWARIYDGKVCYFGLEYMV